MIDPIKIKVNYLDMSLFKDIPNISYEEKADIEISKVDNRWQVVANGKEEFWVETLQNHIDLRLTGVEMPIFILTKDKDLLPYCMKDRLAYLQDRTNKEKA